MALFIRVLGTTLMAVLLWRLVAWRAWKFYPFFFWYFSLVTARWFVLLGVRQSLSPTSNAYGLLFWYSSLFLQLLKFFVAWEVYRLILPRSGTASRVAGLLLGAAMLMLAGIYGMTGTANLNFFVALEMNFAFAVALWMVGALAIVRYYGYPISLNIWGIALGIGILGALAVVNFSALGIDETVFPVFGYVRSLSFTATLALWIWTLWVYQPTVQRPPETGAGMGNPDLADKVKERLRRAMGL